MPSRRRSSSTSSLEAPYQHIPTSSEVAVPSAVLESSGVSAEEDEEGVDVPNLPPDSRIRWVHFLLGCAVLLPWNVLITATPFFLSRLEGTSIYKLFSSYLSVSFTISNFTFLAHATATTKNSSPARRIRWAIIQLAILNFLLTLSTFISLPPGLFAAVVLVAGVTMAGTGSYLQTAVFAIGSLFGPNVLQAIMSGQAAVAIVVSAVQLLSATASVHTSGDLSAAALMQAQDDAAARSARAFFALSTLFLLATAVASVWMSRLPAYKAVVAPTEHTRSWSRRLSHDLGEERAFLAESTDNIAPPAKDTKARILDIAGRNLVYEVAVAYVFIVTLSVYPPITISVQPVHPDTNGLIFSSVHFLIFNLGDFTGRSLCSFPALLTWNDKRLLAFSLARTLFIPLFLLCNINTDTTPFINSDALFFLILLLFGVSNGYVGSMCMMSAPSLEHNKRLKERREDVDVAATVISFCLVGGLVIGSFASFGVRALMCRCNPFMG
ncbi:hypothetical protein PENSPDRAFT_645434 [Peniophora sp. CONT]|nr:hypothetical protein PENSPDRAFT_645434 [Peniophora sp. CONT]